MTKLFTLGGDVMPGMAIRWNIRGHALHETNSGISDRPDFVGVV